MRFQRVIEQVYCQPWVITVEGWSAVHKLVSEHILKPSAERPSEDYFGDPLPVARIDRGVSIIPVEGVVTRRAGLMEKQCGAVDTLDISEDLAKAMANPLVHSVILDFDSPGGTVGGVEELANEVKEAAKTKNVVSFAGGMMCSAAYWIGAGARRVWATSSSDVGSIGVFVPWIDKTEAYAQMGYAVDIIRAGKYKGMGYPGTALTPEQRQYIQDGVNETYTSFTNFVKASRGKRVTDDILQGQVYSGKQASENGLVTGLVSNLNELVQKLVDANT